MYGGGYQRLLYVGRVLVGNDIIPSPVHHYGRGGSEMTRFVKDGEVYAQKNVEVRRIILFRIHARLGGFRPMVQKIRLGFGWTVLR